MYDEILVDEVQDLSGHDWEVVDVLLRSTIQVRMVGDIRQAVLSTNPRSSKNKRYAYADAVNWFREREARGMLTIDEMATTWRCRPEIAAFADTIFDASWGFPSTASENKLETGHDGVFLVRHIDVREYMEHFRPRCLRHSASSGRDLDLEYINFGLAKGMAWERVLIVPTRGIMDFVQSRVYLDAVPAARFYVAVTRAAQSVALVVDDPGASELPYWTPGSGAQQRHAAAGAALGR
jgi:superfamily I DNA/RNA helicase